MALGIKKFASVEKVLNNNGKLSVSSSFGFRTVAVFTVVQKRFFVMTSFLFMVFQFYSELQKKNPNYLYGVASHHLSALFVEN